MGDQFIIYNDLLFTDKWLGDRFKFFDRVCKQFMIIVYNLRPTGEWMCDRFKHFNRVCDQFTVAHLQPGIPRSHGHQQST